MKIVFYFYLLLLYTSFDTKYVEKLKKALSIKNQVTHEKSDIWQENNK